MVNSVPAPLPVLRKDLSISALLASVRQAFESVEDQRRQSHIEFALAEVLSAALAIFSLKFSSLLQFDKQFPLDARLRHNLASLFGVSNVPSDTQMRSILDPIKPEALRPAFRVVHTALQRGNAMIPYRYLGGKLLLAIDGTGQFSSTSISCKHCCIKHKKTGDEYYHQLLGAVIVHPKLKNVLPLDFEPITRADGYTKNDCECNASKRLLSSVSKQYSKRNFIVLEDALSANGPHILELQKQAMDYIIVAKPGNNATLFETLQTRLQQERYQEWEQIDEKTSLTRGYRIYNQVPLNNTHKALLVNVLEYWEVDKKGKERQWCWITNLSISQTNAYEIMRAGRTRWRIENETFNTLKNQQYNFEHNYGHGEQYLCSVLSGLMFLCFLIDQTQEHACRVFQKARELYGSRKMLWEKFRTLVFGFYIADWETLMHAVVEPDSLQFELASVNTS